MFKSLLSKKEKTAVFLLLFANILLLLTIWMERTYAQLSFDQLLFPVVFLPLSVLLFRAVPGKAKKGVLRIAPGGTKMGHSNYLKLTRNFIRRPDPKA